MFERKIRRTYVRVRSRSCFIPRFYSQIGKGSSEHVTQVAQQAVPSNERAVRDSSSATGNVFYPRIDPSSSGGTVRYR